MHRCKHIVYNVIYIGVSILNSKEFGEYFSKLRENAGYESQAALAKVSGVWNSTIARIETGRTKQPDPHTLKKLAPFLNVTPNDLMRAAGYLNNDINKKDNNGVRLLFGRIGKLSPESQKKLERELEWLEDLERKMQGKKRK